MEKPHWAIEHEIEDNKRFEEINKKLDSILEIVSAFRLGGRGVMTVMGFLIAVGTLITIGMNIYHKV